MVDRSSRDLRVELGEPGRDPSPPGWDALVADRILHAAWDWSVLAAWARSRGAGVVAGTVRNAGEAAAVLCAVRRGPLVEVRLPMCSALPGRFFAPGLSVEEQRLAVQAFERALASRGRLPYGVVHRCSSAADLPLLVGRRSLVLAEQPVCVLDVRWDSYDEYLKSLSRSRRHDLRRERRRLAEDPDLQVTWTEPGGGGFVLDGPGMAALERFSAQRQSTRRTPRTSPPEVLSTLQRHPGMRTLAYRDRHGRLLAFALMFEHPCQPTAWTWGALPVEAGGRKHLWFDMVGYYVRHAIENRCGQLVLGKGLVELKQSLGFRAAGCWAVAAAPW